MADTIEKRVQDLEQIPAHLPDDLDARFAGADARAGARFDRLSIQLQALERKVQEGQMSTSTQIAKIEAAIAKLELAISKNEAAISEIRRLIDDRLPPRG